LTAAASRSAISFVPQLSLHTPLGDLTVSEEDGRVVALDWGWGRDQWATPLLDRTCNLLAAYFDAEPVVFDLPLAPPGTPYQRRIWTALRDIPFGETRSYGTIARSAGGSARSVGLANAANPIPILIPCHRVVASAGLGGYSGGEGVATKRALLALEARAQARIATSATLLLPTHNLTEHP
jgi:methylated-DNA-[protein]-cysteine S-methyltransferase